MTRPILARRALPAAALLAGFLPLAAAAADVGYVASLTGDAALEIERKREELSFLDLLPEGSVLHLQGGAELRVCHGLAGTVTRASGPAALRVGARELVPVSGPPPVRTGERCNPPLVSKTQGGAAFRSLTTGETLPIGLRSWLRVVPAGGTGVTKATLLSPDSAVRISEFETISVSPVILNAGSVYPLVVEFADGRRLTVKLAARESVSADVAIISVAP